MTAETPLYRVMLTNPDTLLYAGASWEHVRREIRDYRVLREAGLMQDRELTVCAELDLQYAKNQYLNALQAVEDYGFDLPEDGITQE